MTAPIDRAYVEVVPDLRKFKEKLKTDVASGVKGVGEQFNGVTSAAKTSAEKSAGHFKRAFGGVGSSIKSIVGPMLAIGTIVGGFSFLKGAVESAEAARKAMAQTQAVIKSTGGAAHVSAGDVKDLALGLSSMTGITAGTIRANENLLLTFTGVRNEVGKGNDIFNQASQAVLDMSVALKEDGKSASIQLGKALQDPIKGATALRRVGVALTQQQQDAIKHFVATGHTLEAQKIILKELTTEFGGSAAAQATAGDKMRATWARVKTQIGEVLLPTVEKFQDFVAKKLLPGISEMIKGFQNGTGTFGTIKELFRSTLDVLRPLVAMVIGFARDAWGAVQKILVNEIIPALKKVAQFIREHGTLVRTVVVGVLAFYAAWKVAEKSIAIIKAIGAALTFASANPIVIIIAAIVALVAAFIYAYKHSQKFRDIVDQVIDNVQHAFKNFMHAVDNVKHAFDNVWHAGENFIHAVENIIHAVGNFIHAIGNLIHAGENVGHALGNVVHFFTSIPRYIEDAGKAIVGFFTDLPSNILKLLYQAPTWLINAGIFLIKGFFTGLLDEWKLQVKFFTALPGLIIKFFANAPTWLLEAGKFILKGLLTGLKIYWEIVKFFYWSIPKFILKIFVSAGSWLVDAGRRIIGGLFSGIKTAFLTVAKWWLGLQLWVLRIFINAQVWLLRAGAAIISGLWHAISGAWNSTVGPFFANVGSAIVNKFANAVNWLITAGHNVISGIWNGMGAVWASVKTWLGRRKQAVLDALGDATKWLYSVGRNVITGLWNGIKALGTWLKDQILKIVPKWIKDALGIHSIPGWAVDIGKWIARGLAAGIKKFPHFISNLAKMARDKLSNIGIGSGFDIPKLAQGLYQQYAASLFAAHGWAKNQLAPLVALWQGESGWNPKAKNPSSGAYGIPQSLPASKMDSYGDRNDPAVQIRWGLDYIKGAYGTPSNAWAQWQARSPHWYHQGAWEIPRDQFAFLQRKEMVVPAPAAEKWRANQEIDYERLARVLAKELGRAMSNVSIELDGAQVATSVTKRQGAKAAKGPRR